MTAEYFTKDELLEAIEKKAIERDLVYIRATFDTFEICGLAECRIINGNDIMLNVKFENGIIINLPVDEYNIVWFTRQIKNGWDLPLLDTVPSDLMENEIPRRNKIEMWRYKVMHR